MRQSLLKVKSRSAFLLLEKKKAMRTSCEIPIAFIDYVSYSIRYPPKRPAHHAWAFTFATAISLACIRSSISSVINRPICPTMTIPGNITDIKIPACNIVISPY